jgi:hypothetical protein
VLVLCKGDVGALIAGTNPGVYYTGCTYLPAMANTPSCMDCSTVGVS